MTELSCRHVTTKTWAYSEAFGPFRILFFAKKMSFPPKSLFENTMANPFLETLLKKIRTVVIQHFIKKLLSDLIPDLGKCPNQKTHKIRKYANSNNMGETIFNIKCTVQKTSGCSAQSGGSIYLGFLMLLQCRYVYSPTPLKSFTKKWNHLILNEKVWCRMTKESTFSCRSVYSSHKL